MNEEMQDVFRTIDEAVSYMRENLNVFGRKRLNDVYQAHSVEGAITQFVLSYEDPREAFGEILERFLKPTVHLCYDQICERPDAPEEVYHAWAQFWRVTGEQSFDEAISTLKVGLENHPESATLHGDIANEYFLEMCQAKDQGNWREVMNYGQLSMEYARRTAKIDPTHGVENMQKVLNLAQMMITSAELQIRSAGYTNNPQEEN